MGEMMYQYSQQLEPPVHDQFRAGMDIIPVTDICQLTGHLVGNTIVPLLPGGLVKVERNLIVSSYSGSTGSAKHDRTGEFRVDRVPGGHIHFSLHGTAGSDWDHAGGQSIGDSLRLEQNVFPPLFSGRSGPKRSRGDLIQLNDVNVKIEKVDPVEATPLSVPLRTVSLPTDLMPFETEDVKSSLEAVARPVTIVLSDSESEGSVFCLSSVQNGCESREVSSKDTDQKTWTQESSVTHLNSPTSKPLKRKRSDSGSVKGPESFVSLSPIDLTGSDEGEEGLWTETPIIPSGSEEKIPTGGLSANASVVKKSESIEKPLGSLPFGATTSSQVPDVCDGKHDSQVEQQEPITDLQLKRSESEEKPLGLPTFGATSSSQVPEVSHAKQVISDHQTGDRAKARDQQYVFDFAHDMDDATMEELMCDEEEDLEPDFMLDDSGDADQIIVASSFDTDGDRLVPNPKDYHEEVPSWYLAEARGPSEPIQRPASVNSQQFSDSGVGYNKGFEQGSGNAKHLLQEPSSLRNQQFTRTGESFGQLDSIGGPHNDERGELQAGRGAWSGNHSLALVPLPSAAAAAVEALRRFVQASSVRGTFQSPEVTLASMTTEVTPQGALGQHDGASGPQSSGFDSVVTSVAQRNVVANNGAVARRPKPEPVEFDLQRDGSMGRVPVPVKTEWRENSTMGPVLDSRDRIINALKLFEQGRMQMMQEQVNADPNVKRARSDLKVACSMRKNGMWENESRPIGECPGVKIGDCFTYRIEMAIIGLHRAVQAGIAVVPAQYCSYGKPVAGSVVIGVNATYQDDKDMGDTVVYSGQGGLALDKSGIYQDQKLLRGNLGLANSLELGLPVRLIRGHKVQGTSTGTLYSYDGLYRVTGMNYDQGVHGNMVYTFHLQRLPGQPPIKRPSLADLVYPACIMPYPLPINSHPSLPASSQAARNQPSTAETLHYRDGSWTGQSSNSIRSSTPQNEYRRWTEEYEEKPTLLLLPRSIHQ